MTTHKEDAMPEPGSPAWVKDMADVMAGKEASLNANLRRIAGDAVDVEDSQEDDMLDPIPEPLRLTFDDGWTLDLSRTGDEVVELDWTPSGSQRATLDVMHVWEAEALRDALTKILDDAPAWGLLRAADLVEAQASGFSKTDPSPRLAAGLEIAAFLRREAGVLAIMPKPTDTPSDEDANAALERSWRENNIPYAHLAATLDADYQAWRAENGKPTDAEETNR